MPDSFVAQGREVRLDIKWRAQSADAASLVGVPIAGKKIENTVPLRGFPVLE